MYRFMVIYAIVAWVAWVLVVVCVGFSGPTAREDYEFYWKEGDNDKR